MKRERWKEAPGFPDYEIRNQASKGVSQRLLAERYKVKQPQISRIVRGTRW